MGKICKIDGISMRKEIDQDGTIRYYNENNEFHREDGPAIEFTNGYKAWYKNGFLHKEDGHAIEYSNGNKEYWYNNVRHPEIKTDEELIRFIKLMVFQ